MSSFVELTQAVNLELACQNCGALLTFKPGTRHLTCQYCGSANEIEAPEAKADVKETSLEAFLSDTFANEETLEQTTVKCDSCHAITTLAPNVSASQCPFCASPLVVTGGTTSRLHRPQYLLPFQVDAAQAQQVFKRWLQSLWFAPSDLQHYADRADRLQGIYMPFWTFDCQTESAYTGQRGEDYFVTESYTTVENGKNVSRTRQVRKTRWYPASGRVRNTFDDLLIEASRALASEKMRALEPWDLKSLVNYNDKYLSGFRTDVYEVDVRTGYNRAKERMDPAIRDTIRQHIGGDRQMIHYVNTTYHDPSFKHILLPIWLSAYKYKSKVYQFIVNGRTGKVVGSRPYSVGKIVLAALGVLAVGLLLYFLLRE